MSVQIRNPTERTCERSWRVEEAGRVFCIHEWDINGAFVPFEEGDESATG